MGRMSEAAKRAHTALDGAAGSLIRAELSEATAAEYRWALEALEECVLPYGNRRGEEVAALLRMRIEFNKSQQTAYLEGAGRAFAVADGLDDALLSRLLLLRYRDGMKWDAIAAELGYTPEHVRGDLRNKALEAYAAAMPAEA